MDKMNCGIYGDLEWLEPEKYYDGPWLPMDVCYINMIYDSDALYTYVCDIVKNVETGELRYTNI